MKRKFIEKLKDSGWTVWEPPNGRKEYPIIYRLGLEGKLKGEFNKLLDEMKSRGSRNPGCEICLYSQEPKELVLLEIDDQNSNLWNILKYWFYVENGGGPFKVELSNKEHLIFGPDQITVLHIIPKDETPYGKLLTLFLAEKFDETRLLKKYKLMYNLFTKKDAKDIAPEKIEKVTDEIKEMLEGSK